MAANNMVIKDAITLDQLRTFLAGLDGRFATPSDVKTYGLSISGHTVLLVEGGTGTSVTVPDSDTKNTAGSTDSSSKLFLIGATSQAASPQTYSHDTAYVGTDGCLYSGGAKVLTSHQDISGKADKSAAVSSITRSGTTFTATRANGTTFTFTQQDNNTWIALVGATSSANGTAGYAPQPPKDGYNTKYLRADGTWAVPPNTTYSALTNTEIDNAVAAAFA